MDVEAFPALALALSQRERELRMPLLNPQQFREIISGRRRGIAASLWRCALGAAEVPYRFEVQRRNRQYDTGERQVHRIGVPVISVGNITLGGTGKTPLVEWIARWFHERGLRVCLVSRGYGADGGARNDEALELQQRLPEVPHVQNPDRVAAAKSAVDDHQAQLIILDDAFQHRRIHRDLDIVLIDALDPFGCDRVFPRGLLREPLAGLKRAHLVALTRADMIEAPDRFEIRRRVEHHHADVPWLELAHAPRALVAAGGPDEDIKSLAGKPVAAFCGIGNPAGFRHTLERCDYEIAAWREFPDHHRYDGEDLRWLSDWARQNQRIEAVVCTHKDLVKIGEKHLGDVPLWAVRIAMQIMWGQETLEARLAALLPQRSSEGD